MNRRRLAKILKQYRVENDLTREEAAAKAKIGVGEFVFVEGGKGAGSDTLRKVARAFRLDFLELMILAGHITKRDLDKYLGRQAA